jgi:hypothetical protein
MFFCLIARNQATEWPEKRNLEKPQAGQGQAQKNGPPKRAVSLYRLQG